MSPKVKGQLLLFILIACAACDNAGLDDFVPQVAVSSVLIANEVLPSVILAQTGPIGEFYDRNERAINDAEVQLTLVRNDGTVEIFPYERANNGRGLYKHVDRRDSILVEGGERYQLEVVVPGFADTVRAETIVPAAFSVADPPPDTVFYQVGPSPKLSITSSSFPGRQNIYVYNIRALDPENFPLTPFASDLVNDRDVNPVDLYEGNSPLLNEASYQVNEDGSVRISIVWLGFNFYGPQRFLITALDDALVQFIQSQTIQFLPTTLSPGEIPNVVSNVENGVGVFGAAAQATAFTFLEPAP